MSNTIWNSNQRFQKVWKKLFCPTPFLSHLKIVPRSSQNEAKIDVHWVWSNHLPLESPWTGDFKKTKMFWPVSPKNWLWDQNDPKCLGASHQSSSTIIPTLLKSSQKADLRYGSWPHFAPQNGQWSVVFTGKLHQQHWSLAQFNEHVTTSKTFCL